MYLLGKLCYKYFSTDIHFLNLVFAFAFAFLLGREAQSFIGPIRVNNNKHLKSVTFGLCESSVTVVTALLNISNKEISGLTK